jgi:acyl-CoA dehydrogenase
MSLPDLLQKIHKIGEEVIRPAAADVDHNARFPHEAIDALRRERLLSAYIPREYGGAGLSLTELVAIAQVLAQYCSSTAMIWAMHQIQIACIVQHEQNSPFFRQFLRQAAEEQLLIASITSEVGIGGDTRSSSAAVEEFENDCKLDKKATTTSYGAYADGFLATARRNADAPPNDQVLVLLRRLDTHLTQTSQWNTFGMRGTCSPGFHVISTFPKEHILSTSFADISAQTMVPFSHLLWASCWSGIATDALARARKFMQAKARQMRASSIPGDSRLVDASSKLQLMKSNINDTVYEYEQILQQDPEHREEFTSNMGFAIKLNNVKLLSSDLVLQIVQQALFICGMAGYSETSPFSIARHLRDAYSAPLMISNDRLAITNAALLLVHKE